jgi:predicted short-subunit dehydrogenase-like oxidoreductase (DUF2520 family)
MAELEKISFIGCGKVGRTLAAALKNAGYAIGIIASRNMKHAEEAVRFIRAGEASTDPIEAVSFGTVHFIATNDDAIAEIVKVIDEEGPNSLQGHFFFHTSGSISSAVLEPLHKKGAEIASIHPLQVFADPEKALETLPGIYYAIEGNDRAMTWAIHMVDKLQGKLLLIPTGRKVLYHIAGVFAANYLVVLVHMALSIMEEIGESPEDSYQAFLPLMVSALQNIEEFGTAASLTGPIARGDEKTIRAHIDALDQLPPEILRVYKILGQEAVNLAVRSGGISPALAKRLFGLLRLEVEGNDSVVLPPEQ